MHRSTYCCRFQRATNDQTQAVACIELTFDNLRHSEADVMYLGCSVSHCHISWSSPERAQPFSSVYQIQLMVVMRSSANVLLVWLCLNTFAVTNAKSVTLLFNTPRIGRSHMLSTSSTGNSSAVLKYITRTVLTYLPCWVIARFL